MFYLPRIQRLNLGHFYTTLSKNGDNIGPPEEMRPLPERSVWACSLRWTAYSGALLSNLPVRYATLSTNSGSRRSALFWS